MDRETFLTLLTKKIAGELGEADELRLRHATNASEEYRRIYDGILLHTPPPGLKLNPGKRLAAVWNTVNRTSEADKRKQVGYYRYLPLVAASVLIIVTFYWLNLNDTIDAGKDGMVTINAQNQQLDTILKDGSRIVLSRNSRLSYNRNFGDETRSVVLKGNAFFDVAKKMGVPMVVQAGPVNITVKGTAFYVDNSGSRNVEIKLLHGLIEVASRQDSNDRVLLKPGQQLYITEIPGHSLQYTIGNLPVPDPSRIIANSDTLNFSNKQFDSLVLLLEKKYNIRIEIRNDTLKSKRFSGRLVQQTLQEALEALQFTYPFSFKEVDNKIVIE